MASAVISVPFEKHRAEVKQLRLDIQSLVSRARLVSLENETTTGYGAVQTAEHDREIAFDNFFERRAWYHVEIKRMRQDMEKRERIASAIFERLGRDPMEVCNLVVERKRELQRVLRVGESLDRVRRGQRKAESVQNALRPEVARCLSRMQAALEKQKRRHATLQSQRNIAISARKVAIDELRAACEEVHRKSTLLQRHAPRPGLDSHSGEKLLRYLQSNIDILKEALKQDEKKFQLAQRAELREAETAANDLATLRHIIADHQANLVALHQQIQRLGQQSSSPKAKSPSTVAKPQAAD